MTDQLSEKEIEAQFSDLSPRLDNLLSVVPNLLSSDLNRESIKTLAITQRKKNFESIRGKVRRKGYSEITPSMTDLVGVRVMVYLPGDIEQVERRAREIFEIDEANSIDRTKPPEPGMGGYRSLHLVARLGQGRATLNEYKDVWDIPFEIQIRTVLQHAWAEIEHGLGYKSSISLPSHLDHRLRCVASLLEVADREFLEIHESAQRYAHDVSQNANEDGSEDTISAVATQALFDKLHKDIKFARPNKLPRNIANTTADKATQELRDFGILTVADLRHLATKDLAEKAAEVATSTRSGEANVLRLFRAIMLLSDPEKYFTTAWKSGFIQTGEKLVRTLEKHNTDVNYEELFERHGVVIDP